MIHPFIILSPFTRIIGSAHIHTAAPPCTEDSGMRALPYYLTQRQDALEGHSNTLLEGFFYSLLANSPKKRTGRGRLEIFSRDCSVKSCIDAKVYINLSNEPKELRY